MAKACRQRKSARPEQTEGGRGPDDFQAAFAGLRQILARHAGGLFVARDEPGNYCVETPSSPRPDGRRLMFAAAMVMKNYVSFHLMPVYGCPDMVTKMSPELKKRMQGKACFNFTAPDEELFEELARLTETGLRKFRAAGYL